MTAQFRRPSRRILRLICVSAALGPWFLGPSVPASGLTSFDTPAPKPDKKTPKEEDRSESKKPDDQKEDAKKEAEKPEDRFFAVSGATVHTVADGVRKGVTVLSKNGKILAMGHDLSLPEHTEVLDATGYHLYPGLVAVQSGTILGSNPPEDTTNVFSLQMTIALAGGITTAVSGNDAVKLGFGHTDDLVVKRKLFTKIKYATRQPDKRRKLRASFEKVLQYLRDLDAYREKKKKDPEAQEPDKEWIKGEYKTAMKLIRHQAVGIAEANTAHELVDLCELARRYDFDLVVRGAVEGWTVASRMARAGLMAIVTPRRDVRQDETLNRPNGSSIENAAILHSHGVPIAIIPQISAITTWGVAGRDLLHLNMEAAFAVRGGLPEEAALRAITLDAARLLGIDHRVGSIEVGKDADFVITDGDILHYMTLARWTIVNGRVAYDKNKETLFEHIRRDGDPDAPPPKDYWPKRLNGQP